MIYERKVLVLDPVSGFLRMSSPGPLPQHFPDRMVHEAKGLFRDGVLVVVRPAPDDRVQSMDHFFLRARPIGFHQARYFGPEGCPIPP